MYTTGGAHHRNVQVWREEREATDMGGDSLGSLA